MSRFAETQIVRILQEADEGMAVRKVCRKYGISLNTHCPGKSSIAAWVYRNLRV